jgi:hypothetical protein
VNLKEGTFSKNFMSKAVFEGGHGKRDCDRGILMISSSFMTNQLTTQTEENGSCN